MNFLFVRLLIDCAALLLAIVLVPGIQAPSSVINIILVLILFGLINALVRPFLWLLTCPLLLITVGIALLGLNVLGLWFCSWLAGLLNLGFSVTGILPAITGAVVISFSRLILTGVVKSVESRSQSWSKAVRLPYLEQYKAQFMGKRAEWQQTAEIEDSQYYEWLHEWQELEKDRSWRVRLYRIIYRWHAPIYHFYSKRNWTWLTSIRSTIKRALLRQPGSTE